MPTRPRHSTGRGARFFRRSTPGAALVIVALVLLVVGGLTAAGLDDRAGETAGRASLAGAEAEDSSPADDADRTAAASRTGTEPRRTSDPPVRPSSGAGVPVELRIPELGVHAPVVGIEATDRLLTPPDDPQVLGWWSAGAPAGAALGGTLITGHTVSTGGGAFDDLETLSRGDTVTVRTPRGAVRYAVTRVLIYTKASLANHAERVFSQEVPGRLVLVTCEDWNGETYLSNVVVFAEPVT